MLKFWSRKIINLLVKVWSVRLCSCGCRFFLKIQIFYPSAQHLSRSRRIHYYWRITLILNFIFWYPQRDGNKNGAIEVPSGETRDRKQTPGACRESGIWSQKKTTKKTCHDTKTKTKVMFALVNTSFLAILLTWSSADSAGHRCLLRGTLYLSVWDSQLKLLCLFYIWGFKFSPHHTTLATDCIPHCASVFVIASRCFAYILNSQGVSSAYEWYGGIGVRIAGGASFMLCCFPKSSAVVRKKVWPPTAASSLQKDSKPKKVACLTEFKGLKVRSAG